MTRDEARQRAYAAAVEVVGETKDLREAVETCVRGVVEAHLGEWMGYGLAERWERLTDAEVEIVVEAIEERAAIVGLIGEFA